MVTVLAVILCFAAANRSPADPPSQTQSAIDASPVKSPADSDAATAKNIRGEPKTVDETWGSGQSEKDGKPMFVRVNLSIRDKAPITGYPVQVIISAKFGNATPSGLPSQADMVDLEKFEEDASKVLTEENMCVFAAVVTHDGLRDYFFYGKNVPPLQNRIKSVVERRGLNKCGADASVDPEWKIYKAFAKGFK